MSLEVIQKRLDELAREYPQADWTRDDLMTRATETALNNTLIRKYDDGQDVPDLQLESMYKAYARAHCPG